MTPRVIERIALGMLAIAWTAACVAMLRTEPGPAPVSIDMAVR